SKAASNEGSVFSGRKPRAPRWPCKSKVGDIGTCARARTEKNLAGQQEAARRGQRREEVFKRRRNACGSPIPGPIIVRARLRCQGFFPSPDQILTTSSWSPPTGGFAGIIEAVSVSFHCIAFHPPGSNAHGEASEVRAGWEPCGLAEAGERPVLF